MRCRKVAMFLEMKDTEVLNMETRSQRTAKVEFHAQMHVYEDEVQIRQADSERQ